METLKKNYLINRIILELGILIFKIFRKTPKISLRALINLFCITNGKSNDQLHQRLKYKPSANQMENNSIFKSNSNEYVLRINEILINDGYFVLDDLLPDNFIDGILKIIEEKNCKSPNGHTMIFSESNINSEIYRFDYNDVLNNHFVQELVCDPLFHNVAKKYFNAEPIFDFTAMWILTNFLKNKDSKEAAQFFHFDLERPKWLKIFIYLTDVDETKAPHTYIESSHLTGSKPSNLLDKGYVRIEDTEVKSFYENKKVKSIKGRRGTVFIGDTKCWHKGGNLNAGKRIILQLEFASSLFGVNQPKFFVKNPSKKLKKLVKSNKIFSSNISIN